MATIRTIDAKGITGVKVFSATKAQDRLALGDIVTAWLTRHPEHEVCEMVVTQSSDAEFHCLSITVFFRAGAPARSPRTPLP